MSESPATGCNAILGAVLVGGSSRRMGLDKALLPFRGRSLAGHVAAILDQVFPEVVLVTRRAGEGAEDGGPPGRAVVTDRFPGAGPLAGLHAALLHAREGPGGERAVFLTACDLPGLSPELVRHVVTDAAGQPAATPWARVPVADGRLQPLAALYSPECLHLAEKNLRQGQRSMHRFLDQLTIHRVPLTPDLPFFHQNLLFNVNSPEDYRRLASQERAAPGAIDQRRSS